MKYGLIALLFLGFTGPAFGLEKFVCCSPETVSCATGGGATVWHTMLRDRALTQFDARPRCGIYRMFWGTHQCPADTQCSAGPSRPTTTSVKLCNHLSKPAHFAVGKRDARREKYAFGWYTVEAGQCRVFRNRAWANASILYTNAVSSGALYAYDWNRNGSDHNASFCIKRQRRFQNLGVETCHRGTSGYEFRTFSRMNYRDGQWSYQLYPNHRQ